MVKSLLNIILWFVSFLQTRVGLADSLAHKGKVKVII